MYDAARVVFVLRDVRLVYCQICEQQLAAATVEADSSSLCSFMCLIPCHTSASAGVNAIMKYCACDSNDSNVNGAVSRVCTSCRVFLK